MSTGVLFLYDDVSYEKAPGKLQLIYDFITFASTARKFASASLELKAVTFVPISQFFNNPDAYSHYLKVAGLAFRIYGEIPIRMSRDEQRNREEFWDKLTDQLNRGEGFSAGLQRNRGDMNASINVVRKALTKLVKFNNVPAPVITQNQDEPPALIVHVCTIINLNGFAKFPALSDVMRAVYLENEVADRIAGVYAPAPQNDEDKKADDFSQIFVKPVSFIAAFRDKELRFSAREKIDEQNHEQLQRLDVEFNSRNSQRQSANNSAEALRQMISLGLINTDPYKEGLRQIAAPRQSADTPWSSFIGSDKIYDPRLFLEVWKFVYSPAPPPAEDK